MGAAARTKVGAALLLGLFVFAVTIWLSDRYVESEYPQVEIGVSNLAGIARIDVNCRRAVKLGPGEVPRRVDLGDLSPEDHVYLSVYNERGAAAWGYKIFVNGKEAHNFTSGHAGVTGRRTGPYGVGMALMLTSGGDPVGTIGCGSPKLVSASLANYQQAPEMREMLRLEIAPPRWVPPRFPFALIEGLAHWLLLPLAVIGWAVAFVVARRRGLGGRHLGLVLAVVSLALGVLLGLVSGDKPRALLICFEAIGIGLLLVSAVALVWSHTGSPWPSSSSTPDPKTNPE
jgi:hypothetical protein